jgi:MFS family permease
VSRSVPSTGRAGRVIDYITPQVLASTSYRRMWLTGVVYYQAYWVEIVVTGWVVLALTGSPSAVGLVAFFRTLPMLVLGMIFGSLVERFPRIGVLLVIQVVGAATALGLAMLFVFGIERFWLICTGTGLIGCGWAADFATRRALISELTTPETTGNAMSLEALSMQGGKIIAPVAAGVALGIGGPVAAYLILGLLFVTGIVSLLRFRVVHTGARPGSRASVSLLFLIRSGWETAIKIPIVRVALLVTVIMNVLVFPYQQLIALVAVDILAVGPGHMGLLAGAAGAGSAVMAGFLTFRGRPAAARRFYVGGATLGATLLILLAASTRFEISVGLQLILGACFGAFGAMQPALIVSAVEPEMRARALGILAMAIGTGPFGYLLTGALSGLIGPALTIGGMAFVASVLLVTILVRNRQVIFAP